MEIFKHPDELELVTRFSLDRVQTWSRKDDQAYKEELRRAAHLPPDTANRFAWYMFSIECVVAQSRGKNSRQIPDVENIPKLIVDAFTGVLYPDDDLRFVRGVQVEARFGPDTDEKVTVWIFGKQRSDV
jgi:Holliday junction resolvase RusA-like endonuclease